MIQKIKCSIIVGYVLMSSSLVFAAPQVQKVVSPKHKIEAWLIEAHNVPLVSMQFSFLGGAGQDSNEKAGLSQFTCALMDEGAGDFTAETFQRKLDELAMRFGFNADSDRIYGNVQYISKNKDESLNLLKQALEKPRFDEEPLERIRQQTIASIERKKENPNILVAEKAFASVYPNHPYGRPLSGTIESVKTFIQDDCKNFVKNRFAKEGLIIGVAGDITPEELAKTLDDLFGNLTEKHVVKALSPIQPILDGQLHTIQLADRPQTVSVFMQQGIDRHHPDFYAAYILNQILGGGSFQARLMTEVRTKRGLTYGIHTQLQWLDQTQFMMGSCATENDRFYESFDVIKAVYKNLAITGPTEEELNEAKSYITGSFALMLDNTKSIAQFLLRMQKDKLGIDFLEKRNDFIRAVSADQIKKVANDFLSPDKLTFFAAGNPKEGSSSRGVLPDEVSPGLAAN
ncbi:MAG: pitrilysin family protein [Alphaproteobacteria bacterium]|nr:pitrilysin family protein [Alphaproteobacteria bacterium]